MLGCRCGQRLFMALGVAAAALATPALGKPGDKQGWTLTTDARKRTVLFYVPAKDGPRILTFTCLRNDSFEIQFEGATTDKKQMTNIPLTLTNGQASYVARGEVGHFTGTSALTYDSQMIGDAKTFGQIRASLAAGAGGSRPDRGQARLDHPRTRGRRHRRSLEAFPSRLLWIVSSPAAFSGESLPRLDAGWRPVRDRKYDHSMP